MKADYYDESIEVLGSSVVWDELDGKKNSMVYIDLKANVNKKAEWEKQFIWLKEHLERFDKFFRPKIKKVGK